MDTQLNQEEIRRILTIKSEHYSLMLAMEKSIELIQSIVDKSPKLEIIESIMNDTLNSIEEI
tara:strand:+ start:1483 stop:1668 length:186 start_codon:yes stop_codon:yes gene_type:complete